MGAEPAPGRAGPDSSAAANQLSRIERTLNRLRGMIGEFDPWLTLVRQRTELLKSKTLPWITPAAVILSAVYFWIALSQVSLMVHAWSWWRRAAHDKLIIPTCQEKVPPPPPKPK